MDHDLVKRSSFLCCFTSSPDNYTVNTVWKKTSISHGVRNCQFCFTGLLNCLLACQTTPVEICTPSSSKGSFNLVKFSLLTCLAGSLNPLCMWAWVRT
ncbi:hypothetical protein BRADI_4g11025v3 [Brachypodium distachyon]|uniref:Uncharacterized protein n=1 Tax=Brachypodium distachyon TaxID=15368 RepID=A0A0Q3IMC1_BRADI|nr:hypothetical protein BRADI_4g11025v3 [Brachypodium distachyon]